MPIASGDIGLFNESVRGANRVTRSHGEAKFVRQAQKGDVRAFNELVRAYQARAYRLAYRILGDSQMAGDATQEAFLSPFRNFGALRGDSFGSWLVRIVSNACYDQLRKKQRQRATSLEALSADPERNSLWPEYAAASEAPQDRIERRELNELIQKGLAMLPFDQRVVVVLVDAEDHSYEQISKITGINLGTVKSRLARGRNSVRDFLLAEQELLPAKYRRGRHANGSLQKTSVPQWNGRQGH